MSNIEHDIRQEKTETPAYKSLNGRIYNPFDDMERFRVEAYVRVPGAFRGGGLRVLQSDNYTIFANFNNGDREEILIDGGHMKRKQAPASLTGEHTIYHKSKG